MQPRVFRGIGLARGSFRIATLSIQYTGVFAVLWGLGLVVRGWQGWVLLGAPLAALIGLSIVRWRRVSLAVAEGRLRYQGAVPRRDFDVVLEDVSAIYFDRTLPGEPLVLALSDGDERICAELSPAAAHGVYEHLSGVGVPSVRTRSRG